MTAAGSRFHDTAARTLRAAIVQAEGVEVFAIGDVVEGEVTAVTVTCRGQYDRVLAILGRPRAGQVVIHNHPSGVLIASDADMHLAGRYAEEGVGFVIVDSSVSRSTWVVEPHVEKNVPVTEDDIREVFLHALPRAVPGFETRDAQLHMAIAVAHSLSENEPYAVEAGTGTGKSLAYLIPSALWALRNDSKVVISTYTKALQSQLLVKDLPLLQRADIPAQAALLMGRNNYVCKRRLRIAASEADAADKAMYDDVLAWDGSTEDGTRLDLTIDVPYPVWERIESDSDLTLRLKCPHYAVCHYYMARRRAAAAHLVVVNHALLIADRANRDSGGPGVLPKYRRLILDEAHHLENAATGAIGARLTNAAVRRATTPLLPSPKRPGALARLVQDHATVGGALEPHEHPALEAAVHEAHDRILALTDELPAVLEALSADVLDNTGTPVRIRHEDRGQPLWAVHVEPPATRVQQLLDEAVGALTQTLVPFEERMLPQSRAQSVLDVRRGLRRLSEKALVAREFINEDRDSCRWVDRGSKRDMTAALNLAPIEVAEPLRRLLWDAVPGSVATSATLTVGGRFDHWLDRVGLQDPTTGIHPSPFDYKTQALLGLPRDLPEPNDPRYLDESARLMVDAIHASGGGAFVLCTSYAAVRFYTGVLRRSLPGHMPVLSQEGTGRLQLLSRFREARNAVLVGTDSFWEGVDVQGEALRLVIIPRLPFRMPSDPLLAARQERIAQRGGDPFRAFTLPEAIIKLRQGFGRLIRHRSDRGVVLLLDRRIASRRYGRVILYALPPARRAQGPARSVLSATEQFFKHGL
ncbi:MAG: ATP-dependent DNA helicase DinG [Myxococcota bacterium]|jgi:ATP-dependent DNA helicase DinG